MIKDDRSVEIVQYQETPPEKVVAKINRLLKTYRVRQSSLDNGKISIGENIVKLRFVKD